MNYDYSLLKRSDAKTIAGFKILAATILLLIAFTLLNLTSLAIVVGAFGGIWVCLTFLKNYGEREAAIMRFMAANNIQPLDSVAQNSAVPEYLRGIGHGEELRDGYRFTKDFIWPVDITEYQYTEGDGRYQQTYSFTVASFRTKKSYPQLFLDGKANGKAKILYKRGQKVELEGDFNKYFTLYASSEAGSTALAVITPDVMQSLMTSGRKFDIEITGSMISVAGKNSYYTEDDLPVLLGFVDVLQKEFSQLDWSWQPVYSKTGEPLDLERSNTHKILLVIATTIAILAAAILSILPSLMASR